MFRKLPFNNREKLAVVYKLLHDVVLVFLVFFILAIIGEGILPGVISNHLAIYKIIIPILLVVFAINLLGSRLNLTVDKSQNKKAIYVSLFIVFALILNGARDILIFPALVILISSATIVYFFYKSIFKID